MSSLLKKGTFILITIFMLSIYTNSFPLEEDNSEYSYDKGVSKASEPPVRPTMVGIVFGIGLGGGSGNYIALGGNFEVGILPILSFALAAEYTFYTDSGYTKFDNLHTGLMIPFYPFVYSDLTGFYIGPAGDLFYFTKYDGEKAIFAVGVGAGYIFTSDDRGAFFQLGLLYLHLLKDSALYRDVEGNYQRDLILPKIAIGFAF